MTARQVYSVSALGVLGAAVHTRAHRSPVRVPDAVLNGPRVSLPNGVPCTVLVSARNGAGRREAVARHMVSPSAL